VQASLVQSLPALEKPGGVKVPAYTVALSKTLDHAADELASLRPPAEAAADNVNLVSGLRFVSHRIVDLTGEGRRPSANALAELLRSPQMTAFNAAVADLRRKGYPVSTLP
jgi:hypothetical protein